MFPSPLPRVFGVYLLSLLIPLLSTPAVGRHLSSVTNGNHHSQCILSQPSEHLPIEGRSLAPRDCGPDDGEDHIIPADYWSFYPYTTAIRSLEEHEHNFFGPLGYHTRDAEQRAIDQTYLWFIPKRTTTVDATQTVHKAASTRTLYITTTKTTTVTKISRVTTTAARMTVTVTSYDRPYLTPGAILPAWGCLFPTRHPGMYLKHSGGLFWVMRTHQSPITEEIKARGQPGIHLKPVDSAEVERREKARPVASEDSVHTTILPKELQQPVIPSIILGVAQIAGFILVGILLAAMVVLLFVWCSQPLWWPCTLRRKMAKTAKTAKMLGAKAATDVEEPPDGITAPTNTESVNAQRTPEAVTGVAAINSPGNVDGAMSQVSTYPTFPYPAATTTGSQSVRSYGNSTRRTTALYLYWVCVRTYGNSWLY
ncbi:hypothetical protein K440DRAFT_659332 [Wilcoxina mikolae CBS 423.85]|nr:hypothetical protein K440DRAFT_659332 [Wilcoxina mikolae CBS 423.85]